ncbi:hypothetical protein KC460_03115 [Candidatus Dependentiae bacterium]|nr:hypothetical protein [Candidatus Dependentiae bacterium]
MSIIKHSILHAVIILYTFTYLPYCFATEQIQKVAESINITVNPIISPNFHNKPKQTNLAQIRQKQVVFTKINMTLPRLPLDYYTQQVHAHYNGLMHWLYEHRYSLVISGAISAYALLCYLVHKATIYIQDNTHWFGWHRDCSLEQLLSYSQDEITNQLIVAIESRYVTAQNPTNFFDPLMHFMQDIDDEIKHLHHYKKLFLWLDRFYLASITFANTQHCLHIQEKIDRLAYIKHLFGRWIAQQNLQSYLTQENEPLIKRLYHTIKKPLVFVARLPQRMVHTFRKI